MLLGAKGAKYCRISIYRSPYTEICNFRFLYFFVRNESLILLEKMTKIIVSVLYNKTFFVSNQYINSVKTQTTRRAAAGPRLRPAAGRLGTMSDCQTVLIDKT